MKTLLLLLLAIMPLAGFPQSPSQPRLKGIIHVEDLKLAIVQTSPSQSAELMFCEGQREGGKAGGFELFAIDSTNRSVTAKFSTNAQPGILTLTNAAANTIQRAPGIMLDEVSLQTVLDLFSVFSDRTLLQHPLLPNVRFSLATTATNRSEAAQVLKSALSGKQIAVVPDGSKFLLVASEERVTNLNPHSATFTTTNLGVEKTELLPPGSINFTSAPLWSVLMIYSDFSGGKLDVTGPSLPDGKVFLKMQTALTREECLYAFETLVGWHGVKLVPTGTGGFKAVRTD
ncbi:MAG TPA: hypothetical protein VFZ59_05900 [Verrucomicrobiae bacterium]|nr:hypothetical protein [Verrucomicrobiae bacterium]